MFLLKKCDIFFNMQNIPISILVRKKRKVSLLKQCKNLFRQIDIWYVSHCAWWSCTINHMCQSYLVLLSAINSCSLRLLNRTLLMILDLSANAWQMWLKITINAIICLIFIEGEGQGPQGWCGCGWVRVRVSRANNPIFENWIIE